MSDIINSTKQRTTARRANRKKKNIYKIDELSGGKIMTRLFALAAAKAMYGGTLFMNTRIVRMTNR